MRARVLTLDGAQSYQITPHDVFELRVENGGPLGQQVINRRVRLFVYGMEVQ